MACVLNRVIMTHYLFIIFGPIITTSEVPNFFQDFIYSSSSWGRLLPLELQKCTKVIIGEITFTKGEKVNQDSFTPKTENLQSNGYVVTPEVRNKNSSFTFKPTHVKDVQKLREPCTLAFIELPTTTNKLLGIESLYATINSINGILRKDKDYFMFISMSASNTNLIEKIFSKGQLATNIKNKIGVQLIPNDNGHSQMEIITTCFYCAVDATPKLIRFNSPQNTASFPDHLQNFHGKVFKVSCAVLTGWLTGIKETSPGKYIAVRGMLKFSFDHLSAKFNFTGTFFPSSGGGGTGMKYPNGTWAGATGDVYNGNADLGYPTGVVYKRAQVVDFTFPVTYDWLAFTTGIPQPHYSWKSIYWPLSPSVWWSTLVSSAAMFIALMLALKVARNKYATPSKVTTYLSALFLEQDKGEMEKSSSTRLLVAVWLFFGILVTTAYRSKLVSLISFPVLEQPPSTFYELSKTSSVHYQITLQYLRGAAYAILKSSKNPTFQNIFQRMQLEENDAKCYQNSIGTTKHACISWANVASYVYNKNLSDANGYAPLVMAPDTSTFIAVSYAFRKGTLYKEKFDGVISKAVAMGLREKWFELDNDFVRHERNKWEKSENITKVRYNLEMNKALKVEHLLGTFYIWGAGSLVGIFFALVECLAKYVTYYGYNSAKQLSNK